MFTHNSIFSPANDFVKAGVHFSNNVRRYKKSIWHRSRDEFLCLFSVSHSWFNQLIPALAGSGIRPLAVDQSRVISVMVSALSRWGASRDGLFCFTCRCDPVAWRLVWLWECEATEIRRREGSGTACASLAYSFHSIISFESIITALQRAIFVLLAWCV